MGAWHIKSIRSCVTVRDRLGLAEELQTPGLVRGHELSEEKTAEQPPSGRHCLARPMPLLAIYAHLNALPWSNASMMELSKSTSVGMSPWLVCPASAGFARSRDSRDAASQVGSMAMSENRRCQRRTFADRLPEIRPILRQANLSGELNWAGLSVTPLGGVQRSD